MFALGNRTKSFYRVHSFKTDFVYCIMLVPKGRLHVKQVGSIVENLIEDVKLYRENSLTRLLFESYLK